jgi:hypothetical protein
MPSNEQWSEKLGIDDKSVLLKEQLEKTAEVFTDDYIEEASYKREDVVELAKNDLSYLLR